MGVTAPMAGVGKLLAGPLIAVVVGGALPAAAADVPVDPPPLPTWERAAYKTLTFRAVDSLTDGALFALIAGAGAGTSAVFVAAGAEAAEAPSTAPPPLPSWERAAYKTLTFQTAANLADAALFAVIFGTGAGTGAVFLVANTATAAALYFPYEMAWTEFGPGPSATTAETLAVKIVGYQLLTSARNLALSYAFTGALLPSAGFAAAAFVMDSAIYAGNEVGWDAFRPRAEE